MADQQGWFADPSGRFGQRWYDGSAWSPNVVGANGEVITDELPERDTPFPPPAAQSPAAPPNVPSNVPPNGQAVGPVRYAAPPYPGAAGQGAPTGFTVRYGVGAGLFIGLLGVVLVALSLFAINWTDADNSKFTDLSSSLRKLDNPTFPSAGVHAYYLYGAWLAFVLFALVLVLVILAGIPVPHTGPGNRFWRIGASVLAAAGAILHSMMVAYLFKGSGHAASGASVLGIAGWLVVIVGMIFGARRIVRPAGRPW